MNEAVAALVSEFEASARNAQQAETLLRKKMAEEIAALERQRAFAFRRTNFVRLLASSAAGLEKEDEATAAQGRALSEELGWHGESEAHKAILEEMKPVGRSVWQCVCGTGPQVTADVSAALGSFEAWFERTHGTPFYGLFDRYVPEVPVVDF
jgi:hypothetical protein